jgi:hypothetical protein
MGVCFGSNSMGVLRLSFIRGGSNIEEEKKGRRRKVP